MQTLNALKPLAVVLVASSFTSCGAGVPITIRLDNFSIDLDLDEVIDSAFNELLAAGLMNPDSPGFPEIWPSSLPEVTYNTSITTDPVAIDLSPEPVCDQQVDPTCPPKCEEGTDPGCQCNPDTGTCELFCKPDTDIPCDFTMDPECFSCPEDNGTGLSQEDLDTINDVVLRIELNRMVLRIEASSLTIALPDLELQVADDMNADPDDRLAWRKIGELRASEAPVGEPTDIEFIFEPGGESFLNSQLEDEQKEFAMRAVGKVNLEMRGGARRPGGKARIRLIAVATFFIDPSGAI